MAWQTKPARCSERRSPWFAYCGEVAGVAAFGTLRRHPLTLDRLLALTGVGLDLHCGVLACLPLRPTFASRFHQCRGVELLPVTHSDRPRDIEDD
jgi:hypothetical protein